MFSSTSNNRNRLRRSMSTRSIQRPRKDTDRLTPDVAMQHAAAAASRAMRSSQSTSQDSRVSYDRLGGPANVAVPRRRPGSSLRCTEDSSGVSTPCYSKTTKSSTQGGHIEDPALPPITELKGLDGRDSSVPSSYRRLRKAKSMFSTRPRTSQTPYGVPPLPCGDPSDPERSPGFQLPRTMRPSVSFIRGHYQSQKPEANDRIHDTAMHLARSQFIQDSSEPVIQHHRSSFLMRRKKEHKPFRKSFRATSEGAASLAEQNTGGPRSASRSFSTSIKSRLRRVFGFSKVADQQLALPGGSKCVEASAPIDSTLAKGFPCEDSTTERCSTSNTFRAISPSPSRGSLCTSRSRVTSWADSTIANTVTARKIGHRQSLSMVREDSNSYKQMPRTPAKKDVDYQVSSALRTGPPPIGAVDSHDLYHALMEQMGHGILPSPNEEIIFGTVSKHRVVPDRSDSVNSQHGRRTIRHVPSKESSNSPGSFATARCGDQSSPHRPLPRPAKSMQICRGIPSQATYQSMLACFDPKSPDSTGATDDESDDDRGSVIVARFDNCSGKGVMSPSIYSRTTGGNTPVKADTAGIVDTSASDEAGTATIFASQRAVYNSPRRAGPVSSSKHHVNPSGEWQQWISSQVDRIEQASPIRGHIREDAQFQEDDEDLTTITRKSPLVISSSPPFLLGATGTSKEITNRGTWMENRLPSQSNFSRPFSQISDVQSTLPLQTKELENTTQIPSADPVKNNAFKSSKDIEEPQVTSFTSPIRLRSGNLHPPESPTPKRLGAKRSWTKEQQRRYSARRAPIAQDGRANQFRSMRTQRDSRINNENQRQKDEFNDMMENYHQLQDIHSTISSKRMVDLFLDSRRRQMGESTDSKTATAAFL